MRAIILLSAASLSLACAAHADYVDVVFTGTGSGQALKITSPDYNGSVFVGQLHHTLSNGPAAYTGAFTTYCSDLGQYVSGSSNPFEIVAVSALPDGAPMGAAKAQAITDMYAYANGAQLLNTTSNDMASAFQLAVWEVLTDYSTVGLNHNLGITSGLFRATMTNDSALSAGIMSYLNDFLGSIGSNSSFGDLGGIKSGSKQDQLIQIIPGPGALALASVCGVAGLRRRRRA